MKIRTLDYSNKVRPQMEITVQRVEASVWRNLGFEKHHYLTPTLNPSAKCLLFYLNNVPAAFIALLNSPRKGRPFGFSVSRLVVNPNMQGMGLSRIILEFCGALLKSVSSEHELYIKTIHEGMGAYLDKSPQWQATSYNGKQRKDLDKFEVGKYNHRLERKSFCYKFIGEPLKNNLSQYHELLLPIGELRKRKEEGKIFNIKEEAVQKPPFEQLSLFD